MSKSLSLIPTQSHLITKGTHQFDITLLPINIPDPQCYFCLAPQC